MGVFSRITETYQQWSRNWNY